MLNTLRPRQNGRHFTDDIFKRIFFNENVWISIKISLKFVPKGLINNIPALVLIMAWRWPGDKPLSEPMMVRSLTHICVTRPQWVNCHVICQSLSGSDLYGSNRSQTYFYMHHRLILVRFFLHKKMPQRINISYKYEVSCVSFTAVHYHLWWERETAKSWVPWRQNELPSLWHIYYQMIFKQVSQGGK